ncbi:MAG TPA: N-acetylmuramoyl-L-alanine amidase [Stellaceae bacterium]|nr:N-acetylmuramoyl-L-alanine amidase [Stellaceae bacterium]
MSGADSSDNRKPGGSAASRRELLRLAGIMGVGAFSLSISQNALAMQRHKAMTQSKRKQIVMIDPGHGGIDPGCIGHTGTYEKYIAFATAYEVARQLEATGRYKPVLTRYTDVFVPLHQRVVKARGISADLFISVHADSIPDVKMRGASVFTLSEKASDSLAAKLAQQENDADMIGGVNIANQSNEVGSILIDLTRRETTNLSLGLAREIVSHLSTQVHMLEHSQRAAGFAVLKAPDIPSALVEIGCLSNRDEEVSLRTATYRHKVATSIVKSVNSYYDNVVRV